MIEIFKHCAQHSRRVVAFGANKNTWPSCRPRALKRSLFIF